MRLLSGTGPKYTLAALNDRGGDMARRWYIDFSAWDAVKQAQRRKRVWVPSTLKTARERRAWASAKVAQINKWLVQGYHFKDPAAPRPPKPPPPGPKHLAEALEYAVRIKVAEGRRQSGQAYTSLRTVWLQYLEGSGQRGLLLADVTAAHIHGFLDHCTQVRGVAAITRNNYLQFTGCLFNTLVERGLAASNPCRGIRRMRAQAALHVAFNDADIARLRPALQQDAALWVFVQMMYYLYIRPGELRCLKVRHVDLDAGRVHVPAAVSKNKKNESVNMPAALRGVLAGWVAGAGADLYLFGRTGLPGPAQVSKNGMGHRHRAVLDALGFGRDYTLYGWKHTGVVRAYRAGIDIKSIQAQCRHSGVEMTDRYLRSLGLFENHEIRDNFPGI